ncbi:MAG TPA: hypothetical protein VME68_09080 [Acidobacteriaceae bacterium]|nr:hypothetical protein [Acidobacteriaceae bacterium]
MKRVVLCLGVLLVVVSAGAFFRAARRADVSPTLSRGAFQHTWSPAEAAAYLDYRESWWQGWQRAQKDHGTICISCHTVLPYALVRPDLRAQLSENGLSPAELKMLGSIETRVTHWSQTTPYYTDAAHAQPSRGTESVLNAFVLAAYDRRSGQFTSVTRQAFDEAWALQNSSGGWPWQDFHESPWESPESAYWGAALMAIGVNNTPKSYRDEPAVRPHVNQLQDYLRRTYSDQPTINQLFVVWAGESMDGLVSNTQRSQLAQKIERLQHPDGGWSLGSLDDRVVRKPEMLDMFRPGGGRDGSDGCGTGLAVLGLEKAGVAIQDRAVQRGLEWLRSHQYQDGSWWAPSLNVLRPPDSEVGRFMSDAATGYAVLAIDQAREKQAADGTTAAASDTTASPRDKRSGT